MDAPTYRFRLSRARGETTYRLTGEALAWNDGNSDGALAFADIRQIRVYDSPGGAGMPSFTRCTIKRRSGRAVILSSNHFAGLASWETRTETFRPFVDALLRRASAANPRIAFIRGMPAALWVAWIAILIGICIVTPLGVIVAVIQGSEMSGGFYATLSICLGIMASFVPLLRIVRRNRPRRFDGRDGYPA